jgi:ATP-dependent DNA ligase
VPQAPLAEYRKKRNPARTPEPVADGDSAHGPVTGVVLHGGRVGGRSYCSVPGERNWMIHRMDPAPDGFEPLPHELAPMLATTAPLPEDDGQWAFEFKWDGIRVLLWIDG